MSVEELRSALLADPLLAARELLGWELVRGDLCARIVETEAYDGANDAGSHAFRGETPRTRTMFGEPGRAYVYFTYGNHWMLNVVCRRPGVAGAVLIRAAEPLCGLADFWERRPKARRETELLNGPGKLAAAFGIDGSLMGLDLLDRASEIFLRPGLRPSRVVEGTRIGLASGKGEFLPWRFMDAERMQWVSRPHPKIQA